MIGNAVVNLNCNVQVKYLDRYGKLLRVSQKHNKATVHLVDGILRFLKGDFNDTEYNQGNNTPNEAEIYLPVRAGFGRIGVKITEADNPMDRRFNFIDRDEFVTPTFDSTNLQEQVEFSDYTLLRFKRVSQVGYTDNNNAECLEFSLYINPSKLVGRTNTNEDGTKEFIPYDWAYYNPKNKEYEVMLTEVGLFSSSNILLARVLFDGEVSSEEYIEEGVSQGKYPVFTKPNDEDNPITQSESTTIVLTWRIGIVSVGKNDEFVTQNNLSNDEFSRQLSVWMTNYIEKVTGVKSSDWNQGFTETRVRNDIQSEVNSLLGNSNINEISAEEG